MMKRIFGLCAAFLLLILLTACDEILPTEQHVATSRALAMDTLAEVHIFYLDTPTMQRRDGYLELADRAIEIVHMLDSLFSMYAEGSDIYRLNRAGGEFVQVSSYTIDVVSEALILRQITNNAFDITIGAVTALWEFTEGAVPPGEAELAAALETVGTDIIIEGNRIRLVHPEAQIDLGSIGKGFAADIVADFLRKEGVSAIVNLGGDVVTVGEKPDGTPWAVGIQAPFAQHNDIIGVVDIWESSIVSSGIYQRFFYHEDIFYHHTLDPATGFPTVTDVVSVSVIAPYAAWGEGISTAVFVLGADAGMALVDALDDVHGIFVLRDGTVMFSSEIGHSIEFRQNVQ